MERIARQDAALRPAAADAAESDEAAAARENRNLTILGRVLLFLGFPVMMGIAGMFMAWLQDDRAISLDTDFVMPFLLTLAIALAIGFQTNGFAPDAKPKPLIQWPKVKTKRRIVHKHVIKGTGEEIEVNDRDAGDEVVVDKKND